MVEFTSSRDEDSLHGDSMPPPPDIVEDNDVIEEHVGGGGGEVSTVEGEGFMSETLASCGVGFYCSGQKWEGCYGI